MSAVRTSSRGAATATGLRAAGAGQLRNRREPTRAAETENASEDGGQSARAYRTLDAFLQAHEIPAKSTSVKFTHTRLRPATTYYIPEDEEDEFERLYYNDIIRADQPCTLTESQFVRDPLAPGVNAIDLDFRFPLPATDAGAPPDDAASTADGNSTVVSACSSQLQPGGGKATARQFPRAYTYERHLMPFVREYLRLLFKYYELDSDSPVSVFVLEKPRPKQRTDANGNLQPVVGDGVHLMFGLATTAAHHTFLRSKMVEWVDAHWCNQASPYAIPGIDNSAESIVDLGVVTGKNSWLKYRSQKPSDTMHYRISFAHQYTVDDRWDGDPDAEYVCCASDAVFGPWVQTTLLSHDPKRKRGDPREVSFLKKFHRELSVRHRGFPMGILRAAFADEFDAFSRPVTRRANAATAAYQPPSGMGGAQNAPGVPAELAGFPSPAELAIQVRDNESLQHWLQEFMSRVGCIDRAARDGRSMAVTEVIDYAMCLPAKYYEKGSYALRLNVGFALHSYHPALLIVYLAFCAQRVDFNFAAKVPQICDKWAAFEPPVQGGITFLSLRWWAQTDAPEAFDQIRSSTLDFFVESVLDTVTLGEVTNPRKKFTSGCSDHDIARVLYKMVGPRFKCISIKHRQWMYFANHRWHMDECGSTLRYLISSDLRQLFYAKVQEVMTRATEHADPESEEYQRLTKRAGKIHATWTMLGDARAKDKIMVEACELFFETKLLDKLDADGWLTCFENGVFDARTMTFRDGRPEDFLTKCTGYPYKPLEECDPEDLARLRVYLEQTFPQPRVREYMLDHAASTFVGDQAINQCLHIYDGRGQNGKSRWIMLMKLMLGEYSAPLDISFYTSERGQMGRPLPELVKIINTRYIDSNEPSEGETLREGPMKVLTSGTDELSARDLFDNRVRTFISKAHPIIAANNPLGVNATDHGTWRRLRRVIFHSLFTRTPVHNDPNRPYQFPIIDGLETLLAKWKQAFAALCIERVKETRGLVRLSLCPEVEQATNEFRREQDVIAAFIEERVRVLQGAVITKTELDMEFAAFFRQNGGDYRKISNKKREITERMNRQFGAAVENRWHGVQMITNYGDLVSDSNSVYTASIDPSDTTTLLAA